MNNEYVFAHLTIILLIAALSGLLLAKFKQPVMLGYILAGVIFGPGGYGYMSSLEQIQLYSELGIILLLFVIGMEINIKSFLRMWRIPTFFTVIQILTNVAIAVLCANFLDISINASLLAAFIISLSSTAAIVKVLEYIGELRTDVGHISIGVLIAQDIAVVPMMLVIKQCGNGVFNISMLLDLAIAVLLVFVLIRYIGKSEKIKLPLMDLISTPDLTPVVTLGLCFASASLVVFLGLSEAYGAFLAGLFIGNTGERQHIMASIKPIQDVLLMVFFLSVGLMFDLNFLIKNCGLVIATLLVVTIWKVISNTVILRRFSIELAKATSIGIILAQLGEFSLILSNVAISSNIIDIHGQKLIVCVTALSLSTSSLFIALSTRTKNLSFVGDNSLSSVLKIILSGKFAREVRNLVTKSSQLKS